MADLAAHAASHWQSLALAAERQDAHLMALHCRQIKALTLEVFRTTRELADEDVG